VQFVEKRFVSPPEILADEVLIYRDNLFFDEFLFEALSLRPGPPASRPKLPLPRMMRPLLITLCLYNKGSGYKTICM